MRTLGVRAATLAIAGRNYWYDSGRYYTYRDGYYTDVGAPLGAVVIDLTARSVSFTINGLIYYKDPYGTCYQQGFYNGQVGYVVVRCP